MSPSRMGPTSAPAWAQSPGGTSVTGSAQLADRLLIRSTWWPGRGRRHRGQVSRRARLGGDQPAGPAAAGVNAAVVHERRQLPWVWGPVMAVGGRATGWWLPDRREW